MVIERPFVLLSAAMSVDGYLDDTSGTRLVLSNEDDMRRVRRLRGEHDAIMVGARTIRRDNPSLAATDGQQPRKVTITGTGDLDPDARFFRAGPPPIVLCIGDAEQALRPKLTDRAELHAVADLPDGLTVLRRAGIGSLMVEGGGRLHTEFLTLGLADELRLAVAPFFVGETGAPRFTEPGTFVHDRRNRMRLAATEQLGDMAVLHYLLGGDSGR